MGTRDLPDMQSKSCRPEGIHIRQIMSAHATTTINGERFVGLNLRGFCLFEEERESFSMNILHEL